MQYRWRISPRNPLVVWLVQKELPQCVNTWWSVGEKEKYSSMSIMMRDGTGGEE